MVDGVTNSTGGTDVSASFYTVSAGDSVPVLDRAPTTCL